MYQLTDVTGEDDLLLAAVTEKEDLIYIG